MRNRCSGAYNWRPYCQNLAYNAAIYGVLYPERRLIAHENLAVYHL